MLSRLPFARHNNILSQVDLCQPSPEDIESKQ